VIVGELEGFESCDPEFVRQLKRRVEQGMGAIIN
jgi:hypothetical protein